MHRPFTRALVLVIFGLLGTVVVAACSSNFIVGATPTSAATSTPVVTSTRTPKPTATRTPFPTPNATATVRAEAGNKMMESYFNDGYVSWQNGEYFYLDHITHDWAQLGYYRWWNAGFSPKDFVFKADFAWETGSKTPDLDSGCGFVFHAANNENHYMIYLGLDGYVHGLRYLAGRFGSLGRGYYGKMTNPGQATFTLIVNGNHFHTFVNDKLVKSFTGIEGKLLSGQLEYTIDSGTNKSFGTRCTLTNISIWYPKE